MEIMEKFKKEFLDIILTPIKTCTANHILTVNPYGKKLDKRCAELFHRYVAKLLFMSKHDQPDLQMTIPFLTTRVKSPDEDDWKNLIWLMKFLIGVITDALTLGGKGTIYVVKWWVDASYGM